MATARSVRPSPLKSPATRALGSIPTAYCTWFWKVPSPLPSNTDTSLEPKLATARSVRPSPLKSPATMAPGHGPRGKSNRLKRCSGWHQCGRQGVGARAAEVFHLEIVSPRRDMQVDLVVAVVG